jgi:hypothetical protein
VRPAGDAVRRVVPTCERRDPAALVRVIPDVVKRVDPNIPASNLGGRCAPDCFAHAVRQRHVDVPKTKPAGVGAFRVSPERSVPPWSRCATSALRANCDRLAPANGVKREMIARRILARARPACWLLAQSQNGGAQ